MIATLTSFMVLAALGLRIARAFQIRTRKERRIQTRLIRALHSEFGAGAGHLFRPRQAMAVAGFMSPRRG